MSNFQVGQKVVCVKDNWGFTTCLADLNTWPKKNEIYTIRDMNIRNELVGLRFIEIVNPKYPYFAGYEEAMFVSYCFKPLVLKGMETLNKILAPTPKLVDA